MQKKELWGLSIEKVWLPFLIAANKKEKLNLPPEILEQPFRPNGSIKPAFRQAVATVKENFEAGLIAYAENKRTANMWITVSKAAELKVIVLTLSDPVPDLECEECGKTHKYDPFRKTWDCIVLLDQSEVPEKILGNWCNEKCLHESVSFRWR